MSKDKIICKKEGAVSVVIAALLISMLLVISLGVSVLIFQQLKLSGQVGRSVTAFYAAEAGAEKCLYQVWQELDTGCDGTGGLIDETLDAGLNTSFKAYYVGGDTVISTGRYGDTIRTLELTW